MLGEITQPGRKSHGPSLEISDYGGHQPHALMHSWTPTSCYGSIAHLDAPQGQLPALSKVEDPRRGSDHDIGPRGQAADLGFGVDAADKKNGGELRGTEVSLEVHDTLVRLQRWCRGIARGEDMERGGCGAWRGVGDRVEWNGTGRREDKDWGGCGAWGGVGDRVEWSGTGSGAAWAIERRATSGSALPERG